MASAHRDVAALLNLERTIVDASERHLDDYPAFAIAQLALTCSMRDAIGRTTEPVGVAAADRFLEHVKRRTGNGLRLRRTHAIRCSCMVATTQILRSQVCSARMAPHLART